MINSIKITLPKDVKTILNMLSEHGYEAYVVGGCVRDALVGAEPNDWDICTNARPEQTEEVFEDFRIIETGLKHGTITVLLNDVGYEITTYRTESEYTDGRHPDKVEFVSSLEEDLKRRDFTINAMAYNEKDGLIDYFGGISDLINHVIRCVGNPEERFAEDSLREMRAYRFLLTMPNKTHGAKWTINPETICAISKDERKLKSISKERICAELQKAFSVKTIDVEDTKNMMDLLYESALLDISEKEFSDYYLSYGPCYPFYMAALAGVKKCSSPNNYVLLENLYLAFRQLLPYGYNESDRLENILKSLRFDNDTITTIKEMEQCHFMISCTARAAELTTITMARHLLRVFDEAVLTMICEIIEAVPLFDRSFEVWILHEQIKTAISRNDCCRLSQLAVDGNDIIGAGLGTGKRVGLLLSNALTAVICDSIPNDKAAILQYLKNLPE